MSRERSRFTPEFKEEAVRLVIEGSRPIAQVARQLGINDGTLGNWVAKFRDEHPVSETPLSLSERQRLAELEREVRQLKLDNEFLGKAAVFSTRRRNTPCLLREMKGLRCGGSAGSTRWPSVGSCGITGSAVSRSATLAGRSIERPARSTPRFASTGVWCRRSGGGAGWR